MLFRSDDRSEERGAGFGDEVEVVGAEGVPVVDGGEYWCGCEVGAGAAGGDFGPAGAGECGELVALSHYAGESEDGCFFWGEGDFWEFVVVGAGGWWWVGGGVGDGFGGGDAVDAVFGFEESVEAAAGADVVVGEVELVEFGVVVVVGFKAECGVVGGEEIEFFPFQKFLFLSFLLIQNFPPE